MPRLKNPKKENKAKAALKELKEGFVFRGAELTALNHVIKTIISTLNLDEVLELIAREAAGIVKAKVCTLRLLIEGQNMLRVMAAYGLTEESLRLKDDIKLGFGISGLAAKRGEMIIVNDLQEDERYQYPELARKEGWHSAISIPMVERESIVGALTVYSAKKNAFGKDEGRLLSMFAAHTAVAIENARLFERARVNQLNTMKLLAAVIDAKDDQTEDHSERVSRTCLAIADEFGLTKKQKQVLQYASYLHDLGKISIDNAILNKPGKLDPREWDEMKRHVTIGAEILEKVGFKDGLVDAILHHHARFSGGGYPDAKLKMDAIPIEARILAVADSYEAMVSDRPYRKALSREQAIKELKKGSGTQFDPKVVDAFLKILKKG